ncbi:unnamed protein product [Owenia fusiformis]|uniref:UDP-glucuronosyltransferase n=1 Tax=Owenia fusiformis TaxID=6347 RepID=A0A8J1TGR5_OWEFU|nr:unnamed protein product [Owenia fusiformis]
MIGNKAVIYATILLLSTVCESSRILLAPLDIGFNSRVMNMFKLGKILVEANHEVTIVYSNQMEKDDLYKSATHNNELFNFIYYEMPASDESTQNQEFLEGMMVTPPSAVIRNMSPMLVAHIRCVCNDKTMWEQIDKMDFDLLIGDEGSFMSRIIGGQFNIPTITYINWGPVSHEFEVIPPFNLAFVPTFFEPYADTMTFMERVYNVMEYFNQKSVMSNMYSAMIEVCREFGFNDNACNNIRDLHKNTALVFINRNDAIHYPQPFMPHVVSIDGFNFGEPKPLDNYYTEMLEKAGEHGFILVSFGSMFRKLWPKLSKIFAEAFAGMPQTVIWSYEGPTPEGLGNNTIVNKWIPQQDLMNHPSIKLFVTHCGSSSTFQAVNYALPTVGIPFFWDQPYYCQKLAQRVKSGQTVELKGITSEKLQQAMKEVIKDKTYKENAQIAAGNLQSHPVDPKVKVVYWVEYVLRQKGVNNLRSIAANELNFFQYFLLDIVALGVVLIFMTGLFGVCVTKKVFSTLYKSGKNKVE